MAVPRWALLVPCLFARATAHRDAVHVGIAGSGQLIEERAHDRFGQRIRPNPLPGDPSSVPPAGGSEEDTPQGLESEDCTVELVPHNRLIEFREQMRGFIRSMVSDFVDKVTQQGLDHLEEAERIQESTMAQLRKTKAELTQMIRGYTIEQQRVMIMTRHSITGFCCCDTELDANKDGKLDVQEIDAVLESNAGGGVCKWIPRGTAHGNNPDDSVQGLRSELCPDKFRWQYRDVIGSGAKVSAFQVDRLVDDCITSENWQEFVAGKKTVAHLNKQMKEQR